MQQQKSGDRNKMLIQMMLIWVVSFFLLQQFFGNRTPPSPTDAQGRLKEALTLEAQGRQGKAPSWSPEWEKVYDDSKPSSPTSGPQLAMTDRVKKLEEAIKKYDEYSKMPTAGADAALARFQQINIYDFLAVSEGESSNTHWFDQAEQRLKDMEKTLHGKSGLVKLEISGKLETLQGDFSHLAADRLNRIRQARDVRNQQKLTWKALDVVVNLTGKVPEYSYFLALLIIVVVLKGLTFPFLKKQYQFQQDQARIGPLIKEIQEKMKGRPQDEVQRRIMQVYKENNVNMAAGCLPMLVLMFVLFPVFWMIRDYEYQFTLGKFLWIGSDFASTTPWLAHNLAQFDVILFVAYLGTTILSSLMQPKPADPEQARQQKMMVITMPLIFGVMMWQYQWSSAFMLYWLVLNLVSMYQSWILLRKMKPGDAPVAVTVTAEAAPATPLTPMKGVRTPNPNAGRGNRVGPPGIPGRVPPRHRRG